MKEQGALVKIEEADDHSSKATPLSCYGRRLEKNKPGLMASKDGSRGRDPEARPGGSCLGDRWTRGGFADRAVLGRKLEGARRPRRLHELARGKAKPLSSLNGCRKGEKRPLR